MKVVLLGPARDELIQARDYYLQHASSRIAATFLEQFQNTTDLLLKFPELGQPVSSRLRVLAISHFPYSIIYRITADALIVQAVAHQRRRPGYWAGRR